MRGLCAASLLLAACGPAPGAPQETVVIPQGAALPAVSESLYVHGVIGSRAWFRVVARVGGYDRKLQSGTYRFARGTGSLTAVRALAGGKAELSRLTVPEGYTLLEMAETAERELGIPRASFLAATRDTALLREFAVPAPSFEGFLRPETYLFAKGVTPETVIREMAATFRSEWNPDWDLAGQAQGLDRMALVTLASIVEGEAKADSDRALIAGVFRNRLRLGMPLQADATVQYAIQQARGERKPRLYEKDYAIPSPYNTYLHPGLPPGPVGAPSRKSLEAVGNPAASPFLYYVARPDGGHVFSRTYAEHLRAVHRQRQRR